MAERDWVQTESRDDEGERKERNGSVEALADPFESHDVFAVE